MGNFRPIQCHLLNSPAVRARIITRIKPGFIRRIRIGSVFMFVKIRVTVTVLVTGSILVSINKMVSFPAIPHTIAIIVGIVKCGLPGNDFTCSRVRIIKIFNRKNIRKCISTLNRFA